MSFDRAFLVFAAGVTAAIHVGKLPPALPVLQAELGMTLVQGGFLLSMVQLAAVGLGLAVGLAADGLGLRRVMAGGLVLLAVASALGGLVRDPATLLLLRAAEGMGFLLAATAGPSLIRRLVPPARLASRLGLWGAYMPLGTSLALLAGPLWMAAYGWPAWWWLTAALSLLLALAMWLWVPADPARGDGARPGAAPTALEHGPKHGPQHAAIPSGAPAAPPWRARLLETLRAPGPWLVALAFAVYSSQWLSVIGFLPTVYAQSGLAPSHAGYASALVAAMNMVGNIASGRLLQRGVSPQQLMRVGFGAMAVGAVGLYAPLWPAGTAAFVGPFISVLLFSAVGGLVPGTLFSQAVRLAPSPGTVSTTVGWMQQWSSFGQFAGPPAVAWLASQTGGWQWSWGVTGLCAVIGLWLAGRIGHARSTVH
jgi:MFS family permease